MENKPENEGEKKRLRFPLYDDPPKSNDAGKDIPIQSLPCICCGKKVKPEHTDSVPRSKVDNVGWDWAIAGTISGGYGSRHDTHGFAVCICDDCTDKALVEGRITKVYEGLNRGYSFDQPP